MKFIKYIYIAFIKLSKLLSRKGIYPFLNKEFSKIESNKRVLTIGSGGEINKLILDYSMHNNFDITSFDIDDKMNPDILGDICSYDFANVKFDYIIIAEVLEHLHSPQKAVDNIYKILEEKGTVIVTVPFIFPIHETPYDYYRYTKYGLSFLFRNFKDVDINERNSWIEAINVLFVRLVMDKKNMSRLFAPLFIIMAFINLPFVYILSKIINTNFITSGYLLTAKKS